MAAVSINHLSMDHIGRFLATGVFSTSFDTTPIMD